MRAILISFLLALTPRAFSFLNPNPMDIIVRDYRALRQKQTTRHIQRPKTSLGREELVQIKENIRREVMEGRFVVDAFAAAAKINSVSKDSEQGGMLGELLPQGAVRDRTIDKACFSVPLGVVTGPLESDEGYHLLLVQERKGCKKDEGMTRIVKVPNPGGFGFKSKKVGDFEGFPLADLFIAASITGGVLVAGGLLAEFVSQPPPVPPEILYY